MLTPIPFDWGSLVGREEHGEAKPRGRVGQTLGRHMRRVREWSFLPHGRNNIRLKVKTISLTLGWEYLTLPLL